MSGATNPEHRVRVTAIRFLLLAGLALCLVAAGCGRRAELDTPYQAAVDARADAAANKQPLPPVPAPPPADKPFILDPLLGRSTPTTP